MEITWLGYSCFRLKTNRVTVITDPYPPELGYTLGKQSARIVTVSHGHPDHSNFKEIGGEPRIIAGPGEYEISEVLIQGFATYHDNENGAVRGKNTIYLMEMDGLSICHLGDLGHSLSDSLAEELDNLDVLLVPVGGIATINATAAAAVVRQLEPKIVIPMHYKTPGLNRELGEVADFLKEMGAETVVPQPKLMVSRSNLPPNLQVVVLSLPA